MRPFVDLEPEAVRTTSAVRVRFGETDLMGIVHHASYLSYFEVGRIEWLRRRGVTYATWASRGMHLPVVEATLKYRAPARFDDALAVETVLAELRPASLRFDYRITREVDNALVVEGSTRLACVDDAHAVRRFSNEMLAVLTSRETARD
jgi:acyl-CoA thioester hydrolase